MIRSTYLLLGLSKQFTNQFQGCTPPLQWTFPFTWKVCINTPRCQERHCESKVSYSREKKHSGLSQARIKPQHPSPEPNTQTIRPLEYPQSSHSVTQTVTDITCMYGINISWSTRHNYSITFSSTLQVIWEQSFHHDGCFLVLADRFLLQNENQANCLEPCFMWNHLMDGVLKN